MQYACKHEVGPKCHPSINRQYPVFSANQGDSQEYISSAMNTIILILHFPFFKDNRSILGFIFDIITLQNCHCFASVYIILYWKLLFYLTLGSALTTNLLSCRYRFHFVAIRWHTKVTNLPLLWLFSLYHQPRADIYLHVFDRHISAVFFCTEVNNQAGK